MRLGFWDSLSNIAYVLTLVGTLQVVLLSIILGVLLNKVYGKKKRFGE
jgi:ABC-type sugar transport system permease subunit